MPSSTHMSIQGVDVPRFLYGTAWKEDRTADLVEMALGAGFTGIDTANQRKHYHEAGVGEGIDRHLRESALPRSDLFLQSKFTHVAGQDNRVPFDVSASPREQVRQSFESSLEHLGTDYLDSLLIHGPSSRRGWVSEDVEVWKAMEDLQREKRARLIGVSNVTAQQVEELCELAAVRPAFVQNRCYAQLGWDRDVRRVCEERNVVYQGFSLLTANVREIRGSVIQSLAERYGRSPAQIVFRFAIDVGMICLTGTTDEAHMKEDLDALAFALEPEDVAAIERVSG